MTTKHARTPVAIVGMASIFPDAPNLQTYWDNILNKVNAIMDVPSDHWPIDDYYDPDPRTPDKVYSKRGGFLPEIDFDPLEFGLPPNILEVTDTSQLLSLVIAKDALLDAGYFPAADDLREKTGIVLGVGGGQKLITPLIARLQYPVWRRVLRSVGVAEDEIEPIIEKMQAAYVRWEENSFPGLLGNVITGRIANRFDLGGINTVVDAACASSLSALNMAVNELALGHADMMISGGVDTDNSVFMYMCFSKTPAFSGGEHCRPFDINSDGMMVGEGIGMVVLKRLEDAERDGDRIYAVIKAVGSSSDGRYKSIYAPRGEGQERALRRAYERAGVAPGSVGLIEAHGTGTVAGDITESNTLVRFLNGAAEANGDAAHPPTVALGSVKSQIGHTKAAAGAAGLIKAALAVHHQVLPPMINIDEPNPKLNLDGSPLYLNTEARPWVSPDGPRRAGVSAFGFGGTNFHAVLEEYAPTRPPQYRVQSTARLVLLAADSPAALRADVEGHLAALEGDNPAHAWNELTRPVSEIPAASARLGFAARTPDDAADRLRAALALLTSQPDADEWAHPRGIYYRKTGLDTRGKIVALFAGQGSQYPNMGRELALNFPPVRQSVEAMDAQLGADASLAQIIYPTGDDDTPLNQTEYAQPAIGALSAGLYTVLRDAGFRPDFTAGHSFGELTALWAGGALSDADYYTLVHARGQAMAAPDAPDFDAGTMLAVTGDVSALETAIAPFSGVVLANLNSPQQVVLAGPRESIAAAQTALSEQGYRVIPLAVSAAFHTPLVGHAHEPFAATIQRVTFRAPQIPVYANATGAAYPADPAAIQQQLADHILNPVQFQREIETIYAAGGTVFVEFGPRSVLTNLVKEILKDKPHHAIALNPSRKKDSDDQLRDAVAQLCVLGLPLGAFDPYQYTPPVPPEPARKGLRVKLNGANYVSDRTRQAFEDALNDGFTITRATEPAPVAPAADPAPVAAAPAPAEPVTTEPITAAPPAADPVAAAPSATPAPPAPAESAPPAAAPAAPSALPGPAALDRGLAAFEAQQRDMLAVHERFTANQGEYFRLISDLTAQQQRLLDAGNVAPAALDALAANIARLHDYQAETLRIHEHYLRQQTAGMQSLVALVRGTDAAPAPAPVPTASAVSTASAVPTAAAAPPAPAPTPAPSFSAATPPPPVAETAPAAEATAAPAPVQAAPQAAPAASAPSAHSNGHGVDAAALSAAMLDIISEKTGYPADVLDLSMDMESDLGIDSIKRVEILGAMRERFPALPTFDAEALAELRTLQQIVDYMRQQVGATAAPAASAAPAPPAAEAAPAPVQAAPQAAPAAPAPSAHSNGHGVDAAALSAAMLDIISEKTGYPADVLDLSMDMESDLGIDSIKRVEILGAMRERFPALPTFDAEALAELRTLQQIVDYMRQQVGATGVPAPAAPATPAAEAAPAPVQAAPQAAPAAPAPSAHSNGHGVDAAALSAAMLDIISEKTGYPADVLDLSMDMESDLGIDSIKRVEILGAMRERFPALPTFDAEALAELRTLQQIVDYMRDQVNAPTADPEVQPGGFFSEARGIPRQTVALHPLPRPDYQDFPRPDGAVCVITDDGTPLTAALAGALHARGWAVTVLAFPPALLTPSHDGTLPDAVAPRLTLPDLGEAALRDALASISGPVQAFIHLNPAHRQFSRNGDLFVSQQKTILKHVFLLAKLLQPALAVSDGTGARRSFMTVARLDGALGTQPTPTTDAIPGGLFGLVKSLHLEWPLTTHCRALDIAPDIAPDAAAAHILAELHDPDRRLVEVGYGPAGRVTLVAETPPAAVPAAASAVNATAP